jgi:hypothetical protein
MVLVSIHQPQDMRQVEAGDPTRSEEEPSPVAKRAYGTAKAWLLWTSLPLRHGLRLLNAQSNVPRFGAIYGGVLSMTFYSALDFRIPVNIFFSSTDTRVLIFVYRSIELDEIPTAPHIRPSQCLSMVPVLSIDRSIIHNVLFLSSLCLIDFPADAAMSSQSIRQRRRWHVVVWPPILLLPFVMFRDDKFLNAYLREYLLHGAMNLGSSTFELARNMNH